MTTRTTPTAEMLLLKNKIRKQTVLGVAAAGSSALLLAAAVLCWWFEQLGSIGIILLAALCLCLMFVANACFLQLLNLRRQYAILSLLQQG